MNVVNKSNNYSLEETIKSELKKLVSYTPKVGVFGDTGVGKSSLCNALFGREIAKISDVKACTREPQEVFIGSESDGGIILVDVPGVGEDPEKHDEYLKLYDALMNELDVIIWAFKSDDRKYMSALDAFNKVVYPKIDQCPVIFTITQADKIHPYREWDIEKNQPSKAQLENLELKMKDISEQFRVEANNIVPISSTDKYNLSLLIEKIVEVVPNSKKFAITREAKEENVSGEAKTKAKDGIIDHIVDVLGEAAEVVKSVVTTVVAKAAISYGAKAISWLKSLW